MSTCISQAFESQANMHWAIKQVPKQLMNLQSFAEFLVQYKFMVLETVLYNVAHGSVIFPVNHCVTSAPWVSHDCTWNVKYHIRQVESVSVAHNLEHSISNAKVVGWNIMGMHERIQCIVVSKGISLTT